MIAARKPFKLDQLGSVERGRSRHRPRNDPSLYGGDIPFFQTGDVKAAELYLHNYTQTYNGKGLAQSRLWQPGTVCITIAANIAESAVLSIPGCFPDSVVGFIPYEDKSDGTFIKYYIDTLKHQMQSASRGTTQDNLSVDKLLTFDFLVPEVSEQRRIASILSAYDDLIENNTRRIAILEEMARRIYEEWFVHFRFPGHEQVKMVESELGLIPEGWKIESLGNVCSRLQSGGTPSRSNEGYWLAGTVDWYKTKELWDGFLFDAEEKITEIAIVDKKTRVFEAGTILMAIYGSPTVGRFGITTRRCACNQATLGIEPDTERISKWFLVHTLYSLRHEFNNKAQGAAQQNISKEKVAETKFLLPRMTTLSGFESLVIPMWEMLLNLQRKNLNLRATRDLLLPKLISGELDVSSLPEPEEAIAA